MDPNPKLAQTINNLLNNVNVTSDLDTAYMALSFGKLTIQKFQSMIDALPSDNWNSILYWCAVVDKYNIENQTTIRRALDAATMMPNHLPAVAMDLNNHNCFLVYDRYLFYGYYWANKYNYDQAKWDLNVAYASYDAAVTNCKISHGTPPLWIYGDNSAAPYSGRYYDETGQSLDGYLEFYKFGVTQALGKAKSLWDFENSYYWNGTYYGYLGANGAYECEAGGFEQIIWKLYNYDPSIANVANLITDINNRYLSNLWSSPQWLNYVIQHANTNPQTRLENTQTAWQSIIGAYPLLPGSDQEKVQQLLNGWAYSLINNGANTPAWALLSNPSAKLYDAATGLYRFHSDSGSSASATALAANLLMDMGIIPTSAKLAVPLEEICYEYTFNIIDKDLYAMDFNSNSIKIPLISAGNLTFIYSENPVDCYFYKPGVWNISFSSDWNSVRSINYLEDLPSNRLYYPNALNSANESVPNYIYAQQGFPLAVNVSVQKGVNNIQIFANSSLVYNNTITVDTISSEVCQVQTSNMSLGNYTLTINVNDNSSNVRIAGITFICDLNGDFRVNFKDIWAFVAYYREFYLTGHYTLEVDYDQDERINFRDISAFVRNYITFYSA